MNFKVILWMSLAILNVGLSVYYSIEQNLVMFGVSTFMIAVCMFNVVQYWEEPK